MSRNVLRDMINKYFNSYSLFTNSIFAVYYAHNYIFVSKEINLIIIISED